MSEPIPYRTRLKFAVVRLMTGGRPLSRDARARSVPIAGCLRIEEHRLAERGRMARVARLYAEERALSPDQLPPLYEPQLVTMTPLAFTLSGFEIVDGAAIAQSWHCSEVGLRVRGVDAGRAMRWTPVPGTSPEGVE